MPAIAAPNGLTPVSTLLGTPIGPMREYPVTTNTANAIGYGDLVKVASGTVDRVTTSPTAGTVNAYTPIGVCVGVRYVDPVLKQQQHAQYLPANAVTNGYTQIFVKVIDNPSAIFRVQADANTNLTDLTAIGKNAAITGMGNGVSTTTGRSKVSLGASTIATTNTLAFRILGVEDAGSTYPNVLVCYNAGTHALGQATGQ